MPSGQIGSCALQYFPNFKSRFNGSFFWKEVCLALAHPPKCYSLAVRFPRHGIEKGPEAAAYTQHYSGGQETKDKSLVQDFEGIL